MATVQQTQPNIQMLLATSDYVGALDLITATQDILSRDLAGIHSFKYHLLLISILFCLPACLLCVFVTEYTHIMLLMKLSL